MRVKLFCGMFHVASIVDFTFISVDRKCTKCKRVLLLCSVFAVDIEDNAIPKAPKCI